jgi:DNA helicase-2/ATP-dependent DNA helicase PcrA
MHALARPPLAGRGPALAAAIRARWAEVLGWQADPDATIQGEEARERQAGLDTLIGIVDARLVDDPDADAAAVLADLVDRAGHERAGSAGGVNLLTCHRAKGLEWDAVFLPSLEEGILPIRQARDDPAALAEERRLLYVGITRARVHLALAWAQRRETRGRETRREPSRFLLDLRRGVVEPPADAGRRTIVRPRADGRPPGGSQAAEVGPVVGALRAWRTATARAAALPPYVVAHDATLDAIAEADPRTLAALRRVPGIGAAKLDAYGEQILAVLEAARPRSPS